MLKVHKKGIHNIIIKIMCASACVRTRSCAKNRRRGKLRNKAIRPMTYARVYDAEARVRCEYRRAICRIGVQNIAKRARKAASGAEKVAQRRKNQE